MVRTRRRARGLPSRNPTHHSPPRTPSLKARIMRIPLFRLALGLVASLLFAAPSPAGEPLTPEQKAAVERIIHDYFLAHPEFMVEVLQAAEAKLKADKAEDAKGMIAARRDELLHDATAPVGGNPAGDVTIVEFFDYRCPYCKEVEPALETLLAEDRQLRFVYKEFPVLGPESTSAARAALAARKQDKYDALHRALMGFKGKMDEAAVFKVASSVGLDVVRLKRDMAAPDIDRMLKANLNLAAVLDISGTPGFVIGDEIVPGAVSLEELKRLIETARRK